MLSGAGIVQIGRSERAYAVEKNVHYGIGQSSCQAVHRDAGQHDSRVCRCVGVGPSRGDGLERMPE